MIEHCHKVIYKQISSKNEDILMLNQNMLKMKSIRLSTHICVCVFVWEGGRGCVFEHLTFERLEILVRHNYKLFNRGYNVGDRG
jgi:hypothetical protein